MNQDSDDFYFWEGEYRDNPDMSEPETIRLLKAMCAQGNPLALEEWSKLQAVMGSDVQRDAEESPSTEAPGWMSLVRIEESGKDYTSDWAVVAKELKDRRQWRCEKCRFQKFGSSVIQVHHIDGDKQDNSPANLQVLCAICHGAVHRTSPLWTRSNDSERLELENFREAIKLS